jgi:hypothetical protein
MAFLPPKTNFEKQLEELYDLRPIVQTETHTGYRNFNTGTLVTYNKEEKTIRVNSDERTRNQILGFARGYGIYEG